MSVRTTSAVIAVCDRCGERSGLLDPACVKEWTCRHENRHDRESLRKRLAARGHAVREVIEFFDIDDSSAHAVCSCGWRSRSAKACWASDFADEHLAQVAAGIAPSGRPS